MQKLIMVTLFIANLLQPNYAHDIHVSVSDIQIQDDVIEITIKTFLDDLQIAMGLVPGEELPSKYSSAEEMISQYLIDQVHLSINDIDIPLIPTEIDASNDAVWITIKIENIDITVAPLLTWKSTFLNEIYDDQTNIVNIKKDGKREVFSLSRKKTFFTYQF